MSAVEPDPLFLACTRPALWHGVPVEAVTLYGVVALEAFILAHNPCWLVIAPVCHYGIRPFVGRDYHLFGVLKLWLDTKFACRTSGVWGGSTVSPAPLRPVRHAREVRVHA